MFLHLEMIAVCQVLDSIARLNSSVTLVGESKHSWEDLVTYVTGPFAVLLHVRNNHHFVLATGLASSPQTFVVHDPMLYTNEYFASALHLHLFLVALQMTSSLTGTLMQTLATASCALIFDMQSRFLLLRINHFSPIISRADTNFLLLCEQQTATQKEQVQYYCTHN
jgi:hypothetical protein